jgi:hypothetical protein
MFASKRVIVGGLRIYGYAVAFARLARARQQALLSSLAITLSSTVVTADQGDGVDQIQGRTLSGWGLLSAPGSPPSRMAFVPERRVIDPV